MIAINSKVRHRVYGVGIVAFCDGSYVDIKFSDKNRRFQYPYAFKEYLEAENKDIQDKILEEAENKRKIENKLKKRRAKKIKAIINKEKKIEGVESKKFEAELDTKAASEQNAVIRQNKEAVNRISTDVKPAKILEPGTKFVVYGPDTIKGCSNLDCNNTPLLVSSISILKNTKWKQLQIKECQVCGQKYIHYAVYKPFRDNIECKNLIQLDEIRCEIQRQNDLKKHKESLNVSSKDLVVRQNVFRCRHNEHKLKNIDAKISLVTKKGKIIERKVAAGYCPDCKMFFILESTYQDLRKDGILVCRVSDEKSYLKGGSSLNGSTLAQESILMQYGYTVSQQDGLTQASRRKILSNLVDNNILTRSEIISYLDFFIRTKSSQKMYKIAIERWKSDRDYIEKYNTGKFTAVDFTATLETNMDLYY